MREAGHCVTVGEFQPRVLGIAAPLFNAEGGVLGSLGIATEAARVPPAKRGALAEKVMAAARQACARIAAEEPRGALPARAVG
jgi:DNA-binding IclR family transcriptional regulator